MLTLLKQARSALALLNPEEVRSRSSRLVTIGLVASSDHAYARLEEFLVTGGGPREFVFRAGIEGTISGLKRAFRLIRCFFRGFRSFQAAVGLGVFCHNLIVLADHESG